MTAILETVFSFFLTTNSYFAYNLTEVCSKVENKSALVWVVAWGPFYKHGLTLITAWINNHMSNKSVGWNSGGEITYPIPKLQRLHRWSLGMDK